MVVLVLVVVAAVGGEQRKRGCKCSPILRCATATQREAVRERLHFAQRL